MGQAKARGTLEQRIKEGAMKRKEQERVYEEMVKRRKAQDDEYLASLSPEERKKKLDSRAFFNKLMQLSVDYTF